MRKKSFEDYVDVIKDFERSTERLLKEIKGLCSVLERFSIRVYLKKWAPRGTGDLKIFILTKSEKILKFVSSLKEGKMNPTLIVWNDGMEFDGFYRCLKKLAPKAYYVIEVDYYPNLPIFKKADLVFGFRFLEGKLPKTLVEFLSELERMGIKFLFGKYELSGSRELYILKRVLERCSGNKVVSFGIYVSKDLSERILCKILKILLSEIYGEEGEEYRGDT
ncbi:MAG: hypothetical protein ACTSR0_01185 [Candidatus Asgardarchaeia archaeon]